MIHSQPALRQRDGQAIFYTFWCLCGKRLSVPFDAVSGVIATCHICRRLWLGVKGVQGERFDLLGEDVSVSRIRKR